MGGEGPDAAAEPRRGQVNHGVRARLIQKHSLQLVLKGRFKI